MEHLSQATPPTIRASADQPQELHQRSSYLRQAAGSLFDCIYPAGKEPANNELRSEVSKYAAEFVKTATLFMPGRTYFTALAYAADQADPNDSITNQAIDASLGGMKGTLLKKSFGAFGGVNDIATKGLLLGGTARALDSALTRQNYFNKDGQFDLGAAANNFHNQVLNPQAIGMDLVVFGAAHGTFTGLNAISRGAIQRSPFLSHALTGTTFGLVTGGMEELQHQRANGGEINWSSVAGRALLKGGLDTVAALPGAHMTARMQTARMEELKLAANRATDTLTIRQTPIEGPVNWRDVAALPEAGDYKISDLAGRLGKFETRTEKFFVASDKPQPKTYASAEDYLSTAVTTKDVKVREYEVKGHGTKIVVPESYAQQLDAIRRLRVDLETGQAGGKEHPVDINLLHRALPEDLIAHLDRLPNPQLVRRLILTNEANPMDRWHGQAAGEPNFKSAASANESGEITFFQRNVDKAIGLEMNHEWSHLLRTAKPVQASLFDMAAKLENGAFQPRDRAKVDSHENWAVTVGENFLSPHQLQFADMANGAPVRTWIAAQALQRTMELPSEAPNPARQALEHRINMVEQQVRPIAIANLMAEVVTPTSPEAQTAAIKLLVHTGEGARLAQLGQPLPVKLSGEAVGDLHVSKLVGVQGSVDVSNTYVTKASFVTADSVLSSVNMSGTRLTNSGLLPLSAGPQIEHLDLSRTKVDDASIPLISQVRGLKQLNLIRTNVSPAGFAELRRLLPETNIDH